MKFLYFDEIYLFNYITQSKGLFVRITRTRDGELGGSPTVVSSRTKDGDKDGRATKRWPRER